MESGELTGKWYVLYTRNKQERQARESLPFESVVPMLEKKAVRRGEDDRKVVMVEMEPKYPNYVFVQHDGSKDFFEVCLRNRFVVSFAGGEFDQRSGKVPMPLTPSDVERIFAKEILRDLAVGDDVLVIDGPYKDQEGVILQRQGGECRVAVRIFNITVNETIPEEFLTKNV